MNTSGDGTARALVLSIPLISNGTNSSPSEQTQSSYACGTMKNRKAKKMSNLKRVTRECPVSDLHPILLQAFQAFFRDHALGDTDAAPMLCCETITNGKKLGKLAAWVKGNSESNNILGLILTEEWLVWARCSDQSETVINGANIHEIRVIFTDSIQEDEITLQLSGYLAENQERVSGKFIFEKGPAAENFCRQVQRKINEGNSTQKKNMYTCLR
jgi:hypothetical protein